MCFVETTGIPAVCGLSQSCCKASPVLYTPILTHTLLLPTMTLGWTATSAAPVVLGAR